MTPCPAGSTGNGDPTRHRPPLGSKGVAVDVVCALKKGNPQGVSALLYDLVVASLETMIAQVRVTGEPEWIARQRAGAMAILHGCAMDRVLNMVRSIGLET